MKIQDIKALAEIMNQNGLTSMRIDDGELKIELEKQPSPSVPAAVMAPMAPIQAAQPPAAQI